MVTVRLKELSTARLVDRATVLSQMQKKKGCLTRGVSANAHGAWLAAQHGHWKFHHGVL